MVGDSTVVGRSGEEGEGGGRESQRERETSDKTRNDGTPRPIVTTTPQDKDKTTTRQEEDKTKTARGQRQDKTKARLDWARQDKARQDTYSIFLSTWLPLLKSFWDPNLLRQEKTKPGLGIRDRNRTRDRDKV